jgi:hypothetical protein
MQPTLAAISPGLPVVPSRGNDRLVDEVEQVRWGTAQPGQLRPVPVAREARLPAIEYALYHQGPAVRDGHLRTGAGRPGVQSLRRRLKHSGPTTLPSGRPRDSPGALPRLMDV